MERINLSDFKAISKYPFIEGVFKKAERKLEGKELEFYGVSEDTVKALTEKKISNNDIEFLYDLIPIISNVNIDVDFKEFEKMCRTPSEPLADYITILLQHFKELYMVDYKLNNLEADLTNTMKELNIELPKVKTKDEQLEELYAELSNCKDDKAKRKEIFKQITALDVEDNE